MATIIILDDFGALGNDENLATTVPQPINNGAAWAYNGFSFVEGDGLGGIKFAQNNAGCWINASATDMFVQAKIYPGGADNRFSIGGRSSPNVPGDSSHDSYGINVRAGTATAALYKRVNNAFTELQAVSAAIDVNVTASWGVLIAGATQRMYRDGVPIAATASDSQVNGSSVGGPYAYVQHNLFTTDALRATEFLVADGFVQSLDTEGAQQGHAADDVTVSEVVTGELGPGEAFQGHVASDGFAYMPDMAVSAATQGHEADDAFVTMDNFAVFPQAATQGHAAGESDLDVVPNILILSRDRDHAGVVRVADNLRSFGYAVATTAQSAHAQVDYGPFDLVLYMRMNAESADIDQIVSAARSLIDGGKPVGIGLTDYGVGTGASNVQTFATKIGMAGTGEMASNITRIVVTQSTAATGAFPIGNLEIYQEPNFFMAVRDTDGTILATGPGQDPDVNGRPALAILPTGTPYNGGNNTTGNRVFLYSGLYAGQSDYTANGLTLLANLVAWALEGLNDLAVRDSTFGHAATDVQVTRGVVVEPAEQGHESTPSVLSGFTIPVTAQPAEQGHEATTPTLVQNVPGARPQFVTAAVTSQSIALYGAEMTVRVSGVPNPGLVVITGWHNTGTSDVSAMTLNGQSMTRLAKAGPRGVGNGIALWGMGAIGGGDHVLRVEYDVHPNAFVIWAGVFRNVDPLDPFVVNTSAANLSGATRSHSISLTTQSQNATVVGGLSVNGGDTDPFTANQGNELFDHATGTATNADIGFWIAEVPATVPGTYTLQATSEPNISDLDVLVAAEIRAANTVINIFPEGGVQGHVSPGALFPDVAHPYLVFRRRKTTESTLLRM